jgi:hypothetical protein
LRLCRLESLLEGHGALHEQVERVGLARALLQDECLCGEVLIGGARTQQWLEELQQLVSFVSVHEWTLQSGGSC